jgi:biopolymer transport protein ExbB
MGGVFEALVATAIGLFVAIPAVVAYNIFQRRVRSKIGRADVLAHLLLSVVPAAPPPSAPRPPRTTAVTDGQ